MSIYLQTHDLGIDHLLNSKALALSKTIVKATVCSSHTNGLTHECLYMSKLCPLNSNGGVDDQYKEKWAKMLNSFANSTLWTCGALAGPAYIPLLKGKAAIYTFPFVDPVVFLNNTHREISNEINKVIGWDCCTEEGGVSSDDWNNGPYTASVNLNKYPHKCPKCKFPCYLGLNKIDCSNSVCK